MSALNTYVNELKRAVLAVTKRAEKAELEREQYLSAAYCAKEALKWHRKTEERRLDALKEVESTLRASACPTKEPHECEEPDYWDLITLCQRAIAGDPNDKMP